MESRISATEAARSFSDLLNRVRYRGEEFLVERGGEAVCRITHVGPRRCTGAQLRDLMRSLPRLDDDYLDTVEKLTRQNRKLPRDPWGS